MCPDACFCDAQSITGKKKFRIFVILVMNSLLVSQTTKPLILSEELHLTELSNKQLVYENINIYDQLIYSIQGHR